MNIKDSNKLRAQEEIAARKSKDQKGLVLAKQQEHEKESNPKLKKVYEKIQGGYKIKYEEVKREMRI